VTDGVAASVENDASKMPSLGSPRPVQANDAQIVQDLKKLYDDYRTAVFNEKFYGFLFHQIERRDLAFEIAIAIAFAAAGAVTMVADGMQEPDQGGLVGLSEPVRRRLGKVMPNRNEIHTMRALLAVHASTFRAPTF